MPSLVFVEPTKQQRRPLRERCNVPGSVWIDRKPRSMKEKLQAKTSSSSAGNTPLFNSRPRQQLPPPPLPVLSPTKIEEVPPVTKDAQGVRQFIPYLHFFSPSSPHELPVGNWTHMIRILPASEAHLSGTVKLIDTAAGGGVQGLNIYTPAARSENKLPISSHHLLVARDFLALALPYYAQGHPPPYSPTSTSSRSSSYSDTPLSSVETSSKSGPPQAFQTDAVRVLLVGAPRAILAIAVTYVAYASGLGIEHVMRCVLEEDADPDMCELLGEDARMGLGDAEMRVLNRVVKKGM
ncbi:hypothetical protein B0H10DRAFT_1998405 [Mycena sp. CBHHK59/15]|nr:hypothetical protein B0H10DRAFT_1998405 [Mycena sp. CBHHK59/15]